MHAIHHFPCHVKKCQCCWLEYTNIVTPFISIAALTIKIQGNFTRISRYVHVSPGMANRVVFGAVSGTNRVPALLNLKMAQWCHRKGVNVT